MSRGGEDNGLLERECGNDDPRVPPRLAEDIGCAARSDVPVLISGGPEAGHEIACAIDRRSRRPKGRVDVVDCRERGALDKVMPRGAPASQAARPSILLLQEVHELSPHEQAEFETRLVEIRRSHEPGRVRIIATSSAPLFERVQDGSFDERLYYRLNLIHVIVA